MRKSNGPNLSQHQNLVLNWSGILNGPRLHPFTAGSIPCQAQSTWVLLVAHFEGATSQLGCPARQRQQSHHKAQGNDLRESAGPDPSFGMERSEETNGQTDRQTD